MKKNCVQNILIHAEDTVNMQTFASQVNQFHVDLIAQKLNESNFSIEEKFFIIDNILCRLKEKNGILK